MPIRNQFLVKNEIYHVFNKTLDKIPIFTEEKTCDRFTKLLRYHRSSLAKTNYSQFLRLPPENQLAEWLSLEDKQTFQVNIDAYQLMPNHYHFLLKQNTSNGIMKFMSNIINSITRFANLLHSRTGPIFLPRFKAVQILTEEQYLHTWRYIHLNPYSAGIVKSVDDLKTARWSSYGSYIRKEKGGLVSTEKILAHFNYDSQRIHSFVSDQADYQRHLNHLKNLEP